MDDSLQELFFLKEKLSLIVHYARPNQRVYFTSCEIVPQYNLFGIILDLRYYRTSSLAQILKSGWWTGQLQTLKQDFIPLFSGEISSLFYVGTFGQLKTKLLWKAQTSFLMRFWKKPKLSPLNSSSPYPIREIDLQKLLLLLVGNRLLQALSNWTLIDPYLEILDMPVLGNLVRQ